MKLINWCGHEWETEKWGLIEPNNPYIWYDDSAVIKKFDDSINLLTHHCPKEFKINNKYIISSNSVGLISSKSKFKWGTFEIDAKLPKGKWFCPSFYLWSNSSKIIIFKSNNNKYYNFLEKWKNNPFLWNIKSDIQIKDINLIKNHNLGFINLSEKCVNYKLVWTPEYLKFYYNNKLFRMINDYNIMKHINSYEMNIVITNMVKDNIPSNLSEYSGFNIKDFKYSKLEK